MEQNGSLLIGLTRDISDSLYLEDRKIIETKKKMNKQLSSKSCESLDYKSTSLAGIEDVVYAVFIMQKLPKKQIGIISLKISYRDILAIAFMLFNRYNYFKKITIKSINVLFFYLINECFLLFINNLSNFILFKKNYLKVYTISNIKFR